MKRIVTILLIAILSLSNVSKAQEIKYGLMAGFCFPDLALSKVSGIDGYSDNGSSSETYHINGIVGFMSDSWWEISMEPGFIKKGGYLHFEYRTPSRYYNYHDGKEYSSIELPVLFNIYLNQKFYLSAGLGMDYILSTKNYDNYYNQINADIEILPDINKKFNCSAILGISYKLSDVYDISIRYSMGLTKLASVDFINAVNYPFEHPSALTSIYNNCLQLSLKYNII